MYHRYAPCIPRIFSQKDIMMDVDASTTIQAENIRHFHLLLLLLLLLLLSYS
jgi:hypothetical protein